MTNKLTEKAVPAKLMVAPATVDRSDWALETVVVQRTGGLRPAGLVATGPWYCLGHLRVLEGLRKNLATHL